MCVCVCVRVIPIHNRGSTTMAHVYACASPRVRKITNDRANKVPIEMVRDLASNGWKIGNPQTGQLVSLRNMDDFQSLSVPFLPETNKQLDEKGVADTLTPSIGHVSVPY